MKYPTYLPTDFVKQDDKQRFKSYLDGFKPLGSDYEPTKAAPDLFAEAARIAREKGYDDDAGRVVQAILRTEGALSGEVGDKDLPGGGSFGPLQFYRKYGMLPSYAKSLGVSEDDAAEHARKNPTHAIDWALGGYLGNAIRAGQAKGLRGAELATYAQQHGQRSQAPERAGQNYSAMFGGGQPIPAHAPTTVGPREAAIPAHTPVDDRAEFGKYLSSFPELGSDLQMGKEKAIPAHEPKDDKQAFGEFLDSFPKLGGDLLGEAAKQLPFVGPALKAMGQQQEYDEKVVSPQGELMYGPLLRGETLTQGVPGIQESIVRGGAKYGPMLLERGLGETAAEMTKAEEATPEPIPGVKGVLRLGVPTEALANLVGPVEGARAVGALERNLPRIAEAAGKALPEAGRLARQGAREYFARTADAPLGLGVKEVAGEAPTKRYYHGTGSAFDVPDAAKFDPSGLYGPGYYLTDSPEVAGSYSVKNERSITALENDIAKARSRLRNTSDPYIREVLELKIRDLEDKARNIPTTANVRAVDVPQTLNLLNAEEPVSGNVLGALEKRFEAFDDNFSTLDKFQEALPVDNPTGHDLYQALYRVAEGEQEWTQIQLQTLGYDGIRYQGGKRIPLRDAAGNPIEHDAVVIFPESLPKIRNAISGTPMGMAPETVGGAIGGAYEYATTEGLSPEERAKRVALGIGMGATGGHVLTKGARGKIGLSVEDVSKGAKDLPEPPRTGESPIRPLAEQAAETSVEEGLQEAVGQMGAPPLNIGKEVAANTELGKMAQQTLERAKGTAEQAAELRPVEEGFAGNIRLGKYTEPAQQGITDTLADAGFNEFAGQRRGVVHDEDALAKAKQITEQRSIEDWLQSKPGTILTQEERLALDQTVDKVWQDRGKLVQQRLETIQQSRSTADIDAQIGLKTLEAQALTAVSAGIRSEAGRLLRSYKQALTGEYGSSAKAIQKAFDVLGGTDRFEKWLDEFQSIPVNDTVGQYRMMQQLFEPTKADMFNAWRYASMLSSWKTHAVNIASNVGQATMRPLTTTLAGYPREAAADVYGMMRGIPEGVAAFGDALSTGRMTFGKSQMETVRPRPFGDSPLGRAVVFPSDLLNAADNFFKAVNYSGALHAEAYRMAKGNVTKAEGILRNPSEGMVKRAQDAALYATYQNDPSRVISRIISVANTPGIGGPIVKMILPFIRTPANIYTRGLGMIVQPLVGPLKAGVLAAKGDVRAMRMELAKTVLASGTLAALWGLAQSGNLTGQGPTNPAKRRILEESGWQANSIRVGDRWISYSNLGAISVPMAFVAAVKEGLDEGQRPNRELAADVAQRTYNSMLDVSFLSNLSDLLRGEGIVGRASQLGASVAGSFIPYSSALAATERIIDPVTRAKDNIPSAVQGRIPFASQALPAEPSIYGGTRQQGVGDTAAQILLPWQTSPSRQDPIANEVARLIQSPEVRQMGMSVNVRLFDDTYAGAKQSPEQKRLLQSEAGKLAATYIASAIARPAYQSLSDTEKAATLNKMLSTAYELADLKLGEQLARDPRHQALLAWASIPQYEGVKGSVIEIRQANYEIAQAKAKRAEYRKAHGEDIGDYRFMKDDKKAYTLAQRARLNSDYLKIKKARIDKQFGGALSQAETQGLVGAGNTVLPIGGR